MVRLVYLAKERIKEDIPILVGVFGNDVESITSKIDFLSKNLSNLSYFIAPPDSEKISLENLKSYFENILSSVSSESDLYLYNSPDNFSGNIIKPDIVSALKEFPNLSGVKDSTENINNYKGFIPFLSEDFSLFCGKEAFFSTFLQMIPKELRQYSGIFPSMGNLVNFCPGLYKGALEGNTLEMLRIQELLNQFRSKIYDIQVEKGKQQRGLKFAFYNLYSGFIKTTLNEAMTISPDLDKTLEDFTIDRIKATTISLINQNLICKFYPVGRDLYNFTQIEKSLSEIETLRDMGVLKRIRGPYVGNINSTYRLKLDNDLVIRYRTSKVFKHENVCKEKILFPFLDHTFNSQIELPDLRAKIKHLISLKKGYYLFKKKNPPIVPIGNLYYYDETKEVFPYLYSIQEYLKGKPLLTILNGYKNETTLLTNPKYIQLFMDLGELLGKLHDIKFNTFYESITDIGKKYSKDWFEVFKNEVDEEINEAKKNKIDFTKEIKDFFKENKALIEEESEPVLFHNDFQGQNIIVKEKDHVTISITGLIDFDNWKVGVRAQDFVKMDHWTLTPLNEPVLTDAFHEGYTKYSGIKIDNDFKEKIKIYKLLLFLNVYNFEMDKIKKAEQEKSVKLRFSEAKYYINEMKKIIGLL